MTSNRLPVLDGVRGMAIGLVLLFHCFSIGSNALGSTVLTTALDGMWFGVDLFFVLSGYLITGILLRAKESGGSYFRDFYIRRSFRIFPAYYLVLFLVFTVLPAHSDSLAASNLERHAPYLLLYLQNMVMAVNGGQMLWSGVNHFWSLAVEEQFYLVWPLLVMLTPRRWLTWLCVFVFALALAFKLKFLEMGVSLWTPYTFPLSRADSLVAGAFVAALPKVGNRYGAACSMALLTGAAAVVAVAGYYNHGFALTSMIVAFGTPAMAIIFACLMKAIHQEQLPRFAAAWLSAQWLAWLGRYSYGIYLLHWPLFICAMEWCFTQFPDRGSQVFFQAMLVAGFASTCASLMLAWAMYRAVEAPCMRFADRLREPRPAAAAARSRTTISSAA